MFSVFEQSVQLRGIKRLGFRLYLMNRGLTALVAGIGVIAVIALVISIIGVSVGYATTNDATTINLEPRNYTRLTVSGYGEVTFTPDRAVVTFVSLGYGKTASEALEECTAKASAIISSLESLGISRDNMKTLGLTIRPRYDWEQKPPKIIDYEASYSLQVEITNIELVGKVIDAAFSAGADSMYNLRFTLSKEKQSELTSKAIQNAVANALAKAEAAASSLGLKIIRVKSINISPQQTPPIIVRAAYEGKAEVPIAPGEGTISASVTLSCILS